VEFQERSVGMAFYTYLLASGPHGTIYCGHTDSLSRRVWEHREKMRPGFTAKYGVDCLVWYQPHETRETAYRHEQRIKAWKRKWKIELIESENPRWIDLYETINC